MSVTPNFIGQVYRDRNTGNIWRANSLTPGDWTFEAVYVWATVTSPLTLTDSTYIDFNADPTFSVGPDITYSFSEINNVHTTTLITEVSMTVIGPAWVKSVFDVDYADTAVEIIKGRTVIVLSEIPFVEGKVNGGSVLSTWEDWKTAFISAGGTIS